MIIAIACVVAIAAIVFILGVRSKDLPEPEPESPFHHLDERKAAIYENLRDLQFEYRVGKLSDNDYQSSKRDLQKELAGVLAEVDRLKLQLGVNGAVRPPAPAAPPAPAPKAMKETGTVCPACGAKFDKELKFCGECGKPMKVAQS
ncbi:MAG: zinc ribbon domain-containing protein [Acidobacteriia bacterium]|nr:zinc ribbon domain-containing protein [Terriglobia bacterium]